MYFWVLVHITCSARYFLWVNKVETKCHLWLIAWWNNFGVWWMCRRLELVTLRKHKFTKSELCPGWKLGCSSSLVQGQFCTDLCQTVQWAVHPQQQGVCSGVEKHWLVSDQAESSPCVSSFLKAAVVTSWEYPCAPACTGLTAESLGSPASPRGSCVLCGAGKTGRMWAARVILELCHRGAESQGMGLEQQRACLEPGIPWEPDVLVCFPLGNESLPCSLCFWVPAVPYSHSMLLGQCCSCCWRFRHSLIQIIFFNKS